MKHLILFAMLSLIGKDQTSIIYNFQDKSTASDWYIVDDVVMGGLSKGTMTINSKGNGIFRGKVSTQNNGGFSSIRHGFDTKNVSNYTHVVLRVKGDGKSYQFRIKENGRQRYSFISSFDTSESWQTIRLPFKDFYPSFRGYKLNRPNYEGEIMQEVAILIGNKRDERFTLEIEHIFLE